MQKKALESVLEAISEDVNNYYSALHPSESIDRVRLLVLGEEGVEFGYKFHGIETHPPAKYLSESHLNSLGICLFLASAKLFNKQSRLLVLDDIVTSFDVNHRRRLARLLRDEFKDWQILLLTHEGVWFEILRREFANTDWMFKKTEWDEDNGIQLSSSPFDLQELIIEKQKKKYDVTNDIRKLLESTLKQICYALGVKLKFLYNDENEHRMTGELLNGLRSTVNKKSASLKDNSIFLDIEGSNWIATVGSHDNPNKEITDGDVDVALNDIRMLRKLFICDDCGEPVTIQNIIPKKGKICCKCSKKELEWKE